MTPMGDEFEDQYTSATADLSAGGVAITGAQSEEAEEQSATAWPEATIGPEGSATEVVGMRPRTPRASVTPTYPDMPAKPVPSELETQMASQPTGKTIGMGAAAVLTLGGAAAGAWLYARWQRERNKPINWLRRRFR